MGITREHTAEHHVRAILLEASHPVTHSEGGLADPRAETNGSTTESAKYLVGPKGVPYTVLGCPLVAVADWPSDGEWHLVPPVPEGWVLTVRPA